jgi:hypothetical protein
VRGAISNGRPYRDNWPHYLIFSLDGNQKFTAL